MELNVEQKKEATIRKEIQTILEEENRRRGQVNFEEEESGRVEKLGCSTSVRRNYWKMRKNISGEIG